MCGRWCSLPCAPIRQTALPRLSGPNSSPLSASPFRHIRREGKRGRYGAVPSSCTQTPHPGRSLSSSASLPRTDTRPGTIFVTSQPPLVNDASPSPVNWSTSPRASPPRAPPPPPPSPPPPSTPHPPPPPPSPPLRSLRRPDNPGRNILKRRGREQPSSSRLAVLSSPPPSPELLAARRGKRGL
ncbi:hypothetical protein BZA05DRAFT_89989 [Tricharina praecox]|uniref:uncharacterized protein n=1 Tax=Tricharina praecox TaxID=43433 RepID=UPI00221E9FF9|nr:uncharacterized protein BZA05DRAFT_89989 [Tricharina praecox]KAI5848911.1 hypothetical protein BZA05DRAFT_89989 [Tricharina praecox]